MTPRPPRGPVYQAQQMLNPMIAALTRAAMGKARRSEAAIQGFTDSYAHELGQVNSASPYANAEAGQASIDAALQQSLAGHGSDLASQLAQRLSGLQGSSGAGALAQESGALASRGESAGNARLASGSASLSALLANAANAGSYDAKQPGLAKLSGLQGIRQAEGNAQQAIDQGTLQAESQLPSLIHDQQVLKSENAYRGAQIAQGNARLQIEQQNADTSATREADYSAHLQQMYGLSYGRLRLDAAKAASARSGLSPYEMSSLRQKAASALQTYYDGVPAKYETGPSGGRVLVAGTGPGSQKTYQEAIQSLLLSYPALGPKQVIGMANKLFAPGEGGRPSGHPQGFIKGPGGVWLPPPVPFDGAASRGVESHAASLIVNMAHEYQGTPYVWGGESPKGFDCSGFAQYLYSHAGISIPRTTYTQWTAPNGHPVPIGKLLPGDLVFYKGGDSIVQNGRVLPGHVGIYIGGGKIMDAYGTGYGVRVDSLRMDGYMGARRFK